MESNRDETWLHAACLSIAAMHKAAVGEITGPKRGVVEDVEDLFTAHARLVDAANELACLDWDRILADAPSADRYEVKGDIDALRTALKEGA